MYRLFRKTLWSLLMAMPLASFSFAGRAVAQEPVSAGTTAIPTDADLAAAKCVIGEERTLPGDYYYCLGGLAYGQQNYRESVRFFTTAASWASKPAQFVLGVMALNGDHQAQDRALALAWFTLAAERPDSRFKAAYDQLYKASATKERNAANDLLAKMRPVYGDAVAALRAEKRYQLGMADMQRRDAAPSGAFCMEGLYDPSMASVHCQTLQGYNAAIDKAAVNVFDGWNGHVTVGPLEQVPAPSAKASNSMN